MGSLLRNGKVATNGHARALALGREAADFVRAQHAELALPACRLMLIGPLVVLAAGARDWLLPWAEALPSQAMRVGVAAALLLVWSRARRARSYEVLARWALAYLATLSAGMALVIAASGSPVVYALVGFALLPVITAPLWARPAHFRIGLAMALAPPLAMLGYVQPPAEVAGNYVVWLAAAAAIGAVLRELRLRTALRAFRYQRELEAMALHDPLTGVLNRSGWERASAGMVAAAARDGVPLSLCYLDLDRFKQVNDRFGHAVGDAVLERTAWTLREALRGRDIVGRLGGEEFVLLLWDTGLDGALALAERLRHRVAGLREPVPMTVSIGVAEHRPGESLVELTHRADMALIQAKKSGRDRVLAHRAPGPVG